MRESKIVRASELGQYEFCSMYHYLSKKGVKMESNGDSRLAEGKINHKIHGRDIDLAKKWNSRINYIIAITAGALLLFLLYIFY